jgi:GNAT superfamily N-acetyltransferase
MLLAMDYREATPEDARAIALLHAESWRRHYRGAYRDEFLDGDVAQDRLDTWRERFSPPAHNQFVVLAEEERRLVGFACAYGREDGEWGTLLDNLHVVPEAQGRGTGARLVTRVAEWCRANYPECGLYLWVLEENDKAQRFYARMGARDCGAAQFVPPGGGQIDSRRYAWTSLDDIPPDQGG